MDSISGSERLRHLYLTGVRPTGRDIGTGAYGRVFEVEFCGTLYAAKEIHPILVAEGVGREGFDRMKEMFIMECLQTSALGHENVVRVLGVYNPGGGSRLPILVMERMQESLTSVVEKCATIPMCVKLSMLLDVSRGLWYLHSHDPPIVHRDLTPNNILLTCQFVAKISDLGVAKVIAPDNQKTKTRAPGTVDFMGPEALLDSPKYGPPLDVFSYGGVILHVVNQKWPKPSHYVREDPETGRRVALSERERRQEHLEKMTEIPADMQTLVEQCLEDGAGKRPPISDVSERMRRMKEAESERGPHVNMNHTTWQGEEMFGDATTSSMQKSTAKNSEIDIVNRTPNVQWKEVAPLPVGCANFTAVFLQGSVYIGGGFEGNSAKDDADSYSLFVYNPSINYWNSITTPYSFYGMAVLDEKLLIVGGGTKSGEISDDILYLTTGQWKNYNKMPTAGCAITAVGYSSMLITMGGFTEVGSKWTVVTTTELLDTTTKMWYTCNDLPIVQSQFRAAVFNDTLYLLRGYDDVEAKPTPKVFAASLDTLSSHQLKWQPLPDTPWCYCTPAVLYDKFLMTIGGRKASDVASKTREVCTFNQFTNQWKPISKIPEPLSGPAVASIAKDTLIVSGGSTNERNYSKQVWIGIFQ